MSQLCLAHFFVCLYFEVIISNPIRQQLGNQNGGQNGIVNLFRFETSVEEVGFPCCWLRWINDGKKKIRLFQPRINSK